MHEDTETSNLVANRLKSNSRLNVFISLSLKLDDLGLVLGFNHDHDGHGGHRDDDGSIRHGLAKAEKDHRQESFCPMWIHRFRALFGPIVGGFENRGISIGNRLADRSIFDHRSKFVRSVNAPREESRSKVQNLHPYQLPASQLGGRFGVV